MATASPLDYAERDCAASSDELRAEHFLLYAQEVERGHPEHLSSLGMSAREYAAAMAAPGPTIDESVEAGLMTAEEGRFIQGQATRDDLVLLGYSPDEIRVILADQQARACASSV